MQTVQTYCGTNYNKTRLPQQTNKQTKRWYKQKKLEVDEGKMG